MNRQELKKIIHNARTNTVFYKQLYKELPEGIDDLGHLPFATHEAIMAIAHDSEHVSDIFCAQNAYGIYYQSSATTGKPKSTLFGREEWRKTNEILARKHSENKVICSGDIICNLSVAASASFMAVHDIINIFPVPCSEIPLGCDHDYDYIINVCQQFNANVISGINSTLFGLACHLYSSQKTMEGIERILGGGELFYGSQSTLMKKAFPNAEIIPFLYGTTEAGAIGYSMPGFEQNVFRTIDESCVLENIDIKTGLRITEPGVIGAAVVTSRLRFTAPAIRLDTGDFIQWLEPESNSERLFSIHGRRYPKTYHCGSVSFTETHVTELISQLSNTLEILKFQLSLSNNDRIITLTLSLMKSHNENERLKDKIDTALSEFNNPVAYCLLENHYRLNLVDLEYFSGASKRKAKFILSE